MAADLARRHVDDGGEAPVVHALRKLARDALDRVVEDLRSVLEEHSLAVARAPYRRRAASEEHRAVYDAIVDRDADAAAAAMEAHLAAAERTFAEPVSKEAKSK
jgi:DNA-binding FadR family transcriptional regulator